LPHECKFIQEPGDVAKYTPALPDGARTDDDTDIEWVYVAEIARTGELLTPPKRMAELWKKHINRRIWCANNYARQLLDLEIEPPHTGAIAINPWAEFNISGQFLCEAFGLMAPAMPRTASRIGVHHTRFAVDGEPIQTTQLFAAMIAVAFVENDLDKILDAGVASVDPKSMLPGLVRQVREWHAKHPDDWKKTRQLIKERWQVHGGTAMRDRNGYELNSAATIAALLYGKGDLVETLRLAFNLGWDCDNNAATAATIVGVIKGKKWMDAQGWNIKDVYKNTTRDDMPMDETLTSYADRLSACAKAAIRSQGGEERIVDGKKVYRIRTEAPGVVEPFVVDRTEELRKTFASALEGWLSGSATDQARAVYLALCLNETERLKKAKPKEWAEAVQALGSHRNVLEVLFGAPGAEELIQRASAEGLKRPAKTPKP
jgi:hypothetical protein